MIRNNNEQSVDISARLRDSGGIHSALRCAAIRAVEDHAKSGRKIVVWRQEQVVWEFPSPVVDTARTTSRELIDLLYELRNGIDLPTDDAVDAVIEIQSTAIPFDKLAQTVELLVSFIEKHRNTNSQKVLIAVGAAIRKVLLNIADEQLGLAAELMKSAGSLEVPIEVELEVAKMVVHRFRYAPSTSTEGLSDLADLLLENARVYSTAKLVNREYYGATALNSVLSIVLMRHKEASALIEHVEAVSADWFVELVKNRLRRIAKEIEKDRLEGSVAVVELMRTLATKAVGERSSQGDR